MKNNVEGDFLKWETDMKFDVVIGNPPYQAPKERKDKNSKDGACGKSLWKNFVVKSMSLVKENGHIALIHPSLWRKPENALFSEFKARDLIYVEMHSLDDGIKTFRASTAYDWYILKNSKYNGKTIIKDINGNVELVDISDFNCIPSASLELFQKLLAKNGEEKCEVIFSYSTYETRKPWMSDKQSPQKLLAKNGEEKCEVIYARSSYGSDKAWMSDKQSPEFKFPCVYMNTKEKGMQFWYSKTNKNGHFGKKKVIISENGGFLGIYNDYKGEYGLTQFMFGITINSKKEGEQLSKSIQSEEFKEIWKATQWMSNHREWRTFKYFRKDFWKEFVQ